MCWGQGEGGEVTTLHCNSERGESSHRPRGPEPITTSESLVSTGAGVQVAPVSSAQYLTRAGRSKRCRPVWAPGPGQPEEECEAGQGDPAMGGPSLRRCQYSRVSGRDNIGAQGYREVIIRGKIKRHFNLNN